MTLDFQIGDFAVCPGHGVGQICDIQEQQLGKQVQSFYIIKLVSNGMRVMIPIGSREGMRKLASEREIRDVFSLLADHDVNIDNSAWNRRHREYMEKIKTGSLLEIAEVLRALFLLKSIKKLSFGEKKLLDHCKELLVQEISLSQGDLEAEISSEIDSCFN